MACSVMLQKQSSRSPHIQAITTLRRSADTADWELAVMILEMLPSSGLRHDERSFSIALKATGRAVAWEVACCLTPWMDRAGLRPDSIAFSSATSAIGSKWRLAVCFGDHMTRYELWPDAVNYGCAIGSCQQALQWCTALLLLTTSACSATSANAIITGSLVSACSAVWREAFAIFELMQGQHV